MKKLTLFLLTMIQLNALAETDYLMVHVECPDGGKCVPITADGDTFPVTTEAAMSMGPGDIESASLADDANGAKVISLTLTSAKAKEFESLTAKNVRKRIALMLNGKVLIAPKVMEPIPGGRLKIDGAQSGGAFWENVPWLMKIIDDTASREQSARQSNIKLYLVIASIVLLAALLFVFAPSVRQRFRRP